jgi:hypothetical protein
MTNPTGPEVIPPGFTPAPDPGPRPYVTADQAAAFAPEAAAAAGVISQETAAAAVVAELAAVAEDEAAAAAVTAGGWLTMYDRAKAAGTPGQPAAPKTDAVLIYAGGLTPDPWTLEDIHAQTARYRLPCWVARGAGHDAGVAEAREMLTWLRAHRAPRGRLLVLDLETRNTGPDHDYERAWRRTVADARYWVSLYGSSGNLFTYPATGGGYWVADPPPAGQPARPHMFAHPDVAMTQWRFAIPGQDWDLSVLRRELRPLLWDTHWATAGLAQAQHVEAETIALVRLFADYAGA